MTLAAASGPAAAQEGTEDEGGSSGEGETVPDYGDWFSDVDNFSGPGDTVDATGQDTDEFTFDEDGIFNYYCDPHLGLGMKGSVVGGEEFPTASAGGGGPVEVDPHEAGVPIQPHYVGFGAGLAVIIPLIFTFFQLKYGESPHTSGGND